MKKTWMRAIALVCAAVSLVCFGCASAEEEPTEQEDFTVQELTFLRGELTVYGKLTIPTEREGKLPAVILSHSSGLNADSMEPYCEGFASRGYVAYAFDFCGGSSSSRSDGEEEDMTVFTEAEDLKAALQAVAALDFVDPDRIYLFGTSQGGLVSALTANDCADSVEGLMLLYPAFNIPELVALSDKFGDFDFGSFDFGFSSTGEAFIETMRDFDPYEHIAGFEGNVLIVHGSNDFIVKPTCSEKAAEVYAHCDLTIISGASHGFNSANYSLFGDYDDQVWEAIDAYLASS
ncbi:MAG: alpha/beta hydrolase family protein [Christensenellaceae bacterium]